MAIRTLEVVDANLVLNFIRRANPESSLQQLSEQSGKDERMFRTMAEPGKTILWQTADDILTRFELGYLLSTGDIPSFFKVMQMPKGGGRKRARDKNGKFKATAKA